MHYHKVLIRRDETRIQDEIRILIHIQDEIQDEIHRVLTHSRVHAHSRVQIHKDRGWCNGFHSQYMMGNGILSKTRGIRDHSHSLNKDILIVLHNYEQNKDSYKQQSGGVKSSLRC